jgi:hypothetical protein
VTLCALIGCDPESPPLEFDEIGEMGRAFVENQDLRRHTLEVSLVNPDNGYSQLRLSKYTADGWSGLDEWNPLVQPIQMGTEPVEGAGKRINVDAVPWEAKALRELGEYAFFNFPGQLNQFLHSAIENPTLFGLLVKGGQVETLVWVKTPAGYSSAVTCATCHSGQNDAGVLVSGYPNSKFDYGAIIDTYYGFRTDAGTWGPGRVDVTSDEAYNPTAIPDLRPIAFQKYLHRAGTLAPYSKQL